jgi:hypothetical protein
MFSNFPVLWFTVAALAVTSAASTADPHDGTWTLNAQKSYFGGQDPPKEETTIITEDSTTRHIALRTVSNKGEKGSLEIAFPLSGGPAKFVGAGLWGGTQFEGSVELAAANTWIVKMFIDNHPIAKEMLVVKEKELHVETIDLVEGDVDSDLVEDLQQ